LFYLMAAAVWAGGLFRVMLGDGQSLRECFLAGVADELIVGHRNLPQSLNAYDRILGRWLEQVQLSPYALPTSKFRTLLRMTPTIEKISAITLRVMNMKASVQFYRDVLGMELLYGGERASFSSLRASDSASAILNLEQVDSMPRWGRLIFHVTDVDAFWTHLRGKKFEPEVPRDASWGERYFHMLDPDGHELSFARRRQ
jgi:catechol 2,3-dioxygenase-like lactoylglutathione lyase family enzyme